MKHSGDENQNTIVIQAFWSLLIKYSVSDKLGKELCSEVEEAYTHSSRYYHNLSHINSLWLLLDRSIEINDPDTILLSVIYHDIIYDPSQNNNEEMSAQFAVRRLRSISFPEDKILRCSDQILATKGHQVSSDIDTNLFTDADLSILGADWDSYSVYSKNIRMEYSIYPDALYYPGRKKVLKHFLQMERIYKTVRFFNRYEDQARANISRELASL